MTEPLDFTSVGAPKSAAPPPKPVKRRRRGSKGPVLAVVAVVAVAALAFAVFGGDDGDDGSGLSAGAVRDLTRYCQLAAEFDQVLASTGAASGSGTTDGAPETVKAAVDEFGAKFEELRSVAPEQIGDDVDEIAGAITAAAAGDADAAGSPAVMAATQRVHSFRAGSCGNPGVGDGD